MNFHAHHPYAGGCNRLQDDALCVELYCVGYRYFDSVCVVTLVQTKRQIEAKSCDLIIQHYKDWLGSLSMTSWQSLPLQCASCKGRGRSSLKHFEACLLAMEHQGM